MTQLSLFDLATTNTLPTAAGSGKRDARDFYPTPRALVCALLALVETPPAAILDPCAGMGVFGDVARIRWPESDITGIDLYFPTRHAAYNRWLHGSFFDHRGEYDLVMMNPPYGKVAEAFIRHGRTCLREGGVLIALTLVGLLSGQSRLDFWTREYAPQAVYILPRRPSFLGGDKKGTDRFNYIVTVWGSGSNPADPALRWLDWNYR